MKHKRKRPEWENRGFVFWCKPEGPLPIAFDEQAQKITEAWNALVRLFWRRYHAYQEALRQDATVAQLEQQEQEHRQKFRDALETFKSAKIQRGAAIQRNADVQAEEENLKLWLAVKEQTQKQLAKTRETLKQERKRAAKELGVKGDSLEEFRQLASAELLTCGLNVNDTRDGEATFLAFLEARQRFLSGKGGPPRFKSANDAVSFSLRYTGGGISVEKIFSMKSKRFALAAPTNDKGWATFTWGFGETQVQFRTILDRPFPETCFIKRLRLKRDERGRWSIVFAVEEEPRAKLPHGKKTIALFPGWKTEGGDYMVPDKDGTLRQKRYTWGLIVGGMSIDGGDLHPIALFGSDQFHGPSAEGKSCNKWDLLERIRFMDALQTKADEALEAAKAVLMPHRDFLSQLQAWGGNLILARAESLSRLATALEGVDYLNEERFALQRGLRLYTRYMREKNGIEQRIARYRRWLYYNLGQWIAEQASTVYWRELPIKKLGRKKDVEPVPEEIASQVRRQKRFAAPAELLSIIKEQCDKRGVEVIVEPLETMMAA